MNGLPLSLDHKGLITQLCSSLGSPLSEYNFANLYLFRSIHSYRLIEVSPHVFGLSGRSYQGQSFFMPLFRPDHWSTCIDIAKSEQLDSIYPIPEESISELLQQGHSITISDDDSDYIYDAEAIRTYRGRHYDGQRNMIRQLMSNHDVQSKRFTSQDLSDGLHIIDQWRTGKEETNQANDVEACREGVERADELGLEGWIYIVDSRPAGLLLGGPLTDEMYMFHFSKALPGYRGLSKYMYQHAANSIDPKYKLLNWQQDLGIEGLRHSKQSYHPRSIAKKGRLILDPLNR